MYMYICKVYIMNMLYVIYTFQWGLPGQHIWHVIGHLCNFLINTLKYSCDHTWVQTHSYRYFCGSYHHLCPVLLNHTFCSCYIDDRGLIIHQLFITAKVVIMFLFLLLFYLQVWELYYWFNYYSGIFSYYYSYHWYYYYYYYFKWIMN